MVWGIVLYFSENFSGLVVKSSKFYQERRAIQTAHFHVLAGTLDALRPVTVTLRKAARMPA
jgi:hypothetical protein